MMRNAGCRMAGFSAVAVFLLCALGAESARVLLFLPLGGKSMKNIFYGLGSALSERGHEVVFFNAYKPSSPVPGIREVVPPGLASVFADENFPNAFAMHNAGLQTGWKQIQLLSAQGPRAALASEELDQLLKERFDVVVLGPFAYAFYVVPHVLRAPFVVLTPIAYVPFLTGPLGSPTLPALNPLPLSAGTDRMSFLERVQSVLGHVLMHAVMRLVYLPFSDRLVAEKFGAAVPSAAALERNTSLVLLSSNPAVHYHQPLLPNVVPVGGLHCAVPRPLPRQLTDFLGDDEFVYFSLGSVVRPADMSAAHRASVLGALGALPFKVLLKWDTADRTGLPANVLPSKWLPQQDLLGSGRCRLFVSHAGFASVLEALCHGVPLVTIPVTGDHQFNAAAAARLGVAETLRWDELTADTLRAAAAAALAPERLAAARHRRELIASQPVSPRDLAVHWVEHVIRYGGAPHLRSVAAELNFVQYYALDVLAFLLVVLALVLKMVLAAVRYCCRRLCGRRVAKAPAQTAKTPKAQAQGQAKNKRPKRD